MIQIPEPVVGDTVHYYKHAPRSGPTAAIVTGVHDQLPAELEAQVDAIHPEERNLGWSSRGVALALIHDNGLVFEALVHYSPSPRQGHWTYRQQDDKGHNQKLKLMEDELNRQQAKENRKSAEQGSKEEADL